MVFALLAGSLLAAQGATVSVETLLPQMTDMSYLTRRPNPYFTTAQASSYDRASDPGPKSDPFANGDAGKFIRVEKTTNGNEYVMADVKGPGAAVRVWSANPAGTIRFYFDSESEPRLKAPMADLLTGRVAPFIDPFAYGAAQGTNFYFPLPYAKSLKVTVDESDGDKIKGLYYHVGYRTYEPGTRVQTYHPDDPLKSRAISSVLSELRRPSLGSGKGGAFYDYRPDVVRAGRELTVRLSANTRDSYQGFSAGPGTVWQLNVKIPFPLVQTFREMDWEDAHQPHNVLRHILFSVEVDGTEVISSPLGDFFGTAGGLRSSSTLPFSVSEDGTMVSRLPMPYRKSMTMRFKNVGKVDVPLHLAMHRDNMMPRPGTYALHAIWKVDKGSTRPMRDMNFLNAKGEGMWVGSNLHVTNPTPAWWGEGDEKIYVDNEPFPSTFGTGTEDYYGYAWCSPLLFTRPYHSQPLCNGPGNFGHTNVSRWHVLDPIPFRKAFKFDMEMWHWAEVDAVFAHTAFWYAPVGSAKLPPIDRGMLQPLKMAPAEPVKGAIEGEKLKGISTGGKTQHQAGFWELSSGEQLWWTEAKPGHKLTILVPVAEAGRYEVIGNFCHARDYGIHKIRVNGVEAKQLDFFGTGVSWKKLSLGTFNLPAGETRIEVECVGKRPEALEGHMFGLDYLLLEKR